MKFRPSVGTSPSLRERTSTSLLTASSCFCLSRIFLDDLGGWFPGCRPPDGYVNEKLKSDKGFERRRGSIIVRDPNVMTVKRVQREFEIRAETPTPSLGDVRNRIIGEGLMPVGEAKKHHISTIER